MAKSVTGNYILNGIFSTKGCRINLILTKDSLCWEIEDISKSQTVIPLHQLVAANPCNCSGTKRRKLLQCYYCRHKQNVAAVPLSAVCSSPKSMRLHFAAPFGCHMWKLDTKVFEAQESTNVSDWISAIRHALSGISRPKHLLVFVNPYGGKKKGVKIYEQKVAPIFELAGIESDIVVTQRANHARDMIEDIDIYKYDGIVCVGGDGMFSEVMNSVLLKTQKEKSIDPNDVYNTLVTPRVPLGVIPAGSTNAAATSIMGSTDPLSATLLIVIGESIGVDVCGVYSLGTVVRFAVTFLSYGYFGDVVRDSEQLRWMGPKRYDFTGFKKLLCRKLYEGEVQLQVDVPSSHLSWDKQRCCVNCETCSKAMSNCDNDNSIRKIRWVSERGRFIAVNVAVVSCACCLSSKGISPTQHLGNGYCDVIIVRSCSRLNYLRYLLRTSYHHKSPFDLSFVQVYRVREFKFNPFVTDDKTPATGCVGLQSNWQELNTSVWNCDGEIVTEPSVTARVHCQLINVFGRGYENRKEDSALSQCFKFLRRS